MFQSVEKDHTSIFSLILRLAYLLLAVAIDLVFLFLDLFPGAAREERFLRGNIGLLMVPASFLLSAPVFLYVAWKLYKRERPIFWGIAFLVAAVPVLMMVVVIILGL